MAEIDHANRAQADPVEYSIEVDGIGVRVGRVLIGEIRGVGYRRVIGLRVTIESRSIEHQVRLDDFSRDPLGLVTRLLIEHGKRPRSVTLTRNATAAEERSWPP